MRFSYSKIQSFLFCPLAYKFGNVDKITPRISPAISDGLIAHKILEGLALKKKREEIYDELLSEGYDVENILKIEEIVLKMNNDFSHTKFVEYPFEIDVNEDVIAGRIDRIDLNEGWELIDYKYGNQKYDTSPTLQGMIYSVAWMKQRQVDKIKFSYIDIKRNKKTSHIYTNNDDFSIIGTYIETIKKAHKDNYFPPKPSANCLSCVFNYYCSAWKNWLNERVKVEKPEDMVINLIKLVERNKVKQKEEEKLKEFVRQWMDVQNLPTYVYGDWEIINYGDDIVIRKKV